MKAFYKAAGVETSVVSGNGDMLKTAKECHDYFKKNNFYYVQGNEIPYPNKTKYTDCSAYVTWVLYEYGYTEFKGHQKTSEWFMDESNWKKYGWKKVNLKDAEPGDIIAMNGHVEIYAGKEKAYSCGSTNAIRRDTQSMDSRAKFAIRVTKP